MWLSESPIELTGIFLEPYKGRKGHPFPREGHSELAFLWGVFSRALVTPLSPVPSLLSKSLPPPSAMWVG